MNNKSTNERERNRMVEHSNMKEKTDEPLIDEKEAAFQLGISHSTFRRRRIEGNPILPGLKIGDRYKYRPEDVRKKRNESSF